MMATITVDPVKERSFWLPVLVEKDKPKPKRSSKYKEMKGDYAEVIPIFIGKAKD